MKKRYQYWTKEGIRWTSWFEVSPEANEPIQAKGFKGNNLLNEYNP
jgi:hypothetical protein